MGGRNGSMAAAGGSRGVGSLNPQIRFLPLDRSHRSRDRRGLRVRGIILYTLRSLPVPLRD